jgi:hypothetical protein
MKKDNSIKYLAVVGSRTFRMHGLIKRCIELFGNCVVVSGGAKGVDTYASDAAKELGFETVIIRPEWDKHGRAAGHIRNTEIIGRAEYVMAFWDGVSRGTFDSITKARKYHKPLLIVIADIKIKGARLEIWDGRQFIIYETSPQCAKGPEDLSAKVPRQSSFWDSIDEGGDNGSGEILENNAGLRCVFWTIQHYLYT